MRDARTSADFRGRCPRTITMNSLKKSLLVVVLGSILAALTGCNTMKGLGKDTERAGEKIQENASR